jgi:hypothetical protein
LLGFLAQPCPPLIGMMPLAVQGIGADSRCPSRFGVLRGMAFGSVPPQRTIVSGHARPERQRSRRRRSAPGTRGLVVDRGGEAAQAPRETTRPDAFPTSAEQLFRTGLPAAGEPLDLARSPLGSHLLQPPLPSGAHACQGPSLALLGSGVNVMGPSRLVCGNGILDTTSRGQEPDAR